jgi:hypothetical protein
MTRKVLILSFVATAVALFGVLICALNKDDQGTRLQGASDLASIIGLAFVPSLLGLIFASVYPVWLARQRRR